ncbi:transposase [Escherichia coli]|nr:transposase [Escherichia coli]
MQSLYDWIQTQMKTLSRHSDTAKAFAYLLKQWEALNVYCSNGQVEIDNNIAENAIWLSLYAYLFMLTSEIKKPHRSAEKMGIILVRVDCITISVCSFIVAKVIHICNTLIYFSDFFISRASRAYFHGKRSPDIPLCQHSRRLYFLRR